MDDPHWTFARRGETLTISRQHTAEGLLLVVTDNGVAQSYFFNHIAPLTTFQVEMEAALIRNGWTFIDFSPERRGASAGRRLRLDSTEQGEDRQRYRARQRPYATGELERDARGRRER
jgi:hypothetical protein